MTTINLKDFYPWYTHDEYIEVSDEVAAALKADKLYEAAYQRKVMRNKAQYSLDCDDGIEYSACQHEPSPQELLERKELFYHLWNALNSLPEVQGVRVEAHLILGKSYTRIAKEQGADRSAVRRSVKRGKTAMKKYLKKFCDWGLLLAGSCPWYMRGTFLTSPQQSSSVARPLCRLPPPAVRERRAMNCCLMTGRKNERGAPTIP